MCQDFHKQLVDHSRILKTVEEKELGIHVLLAGGVEYSKHFVPLNTMASFV